MKIIVVIDIVNVFCYCYNRLEILSDIEKTPINIMIMTFSM